MRDLKVHTFRMSQYWPITFLKQVFDDLIGVSGPSSSPKVNEDVAARPECWHTEFLQPGERMLGNPQFTTCPELVLKSAREAAQPVLTCSAIFTGMVSANQNTG